MILILLRPTRVFYERPPVSKLYDIIRVWYSEIINVKHAKLATNYGLGKTTNLLANHVVRHSLGCGGSPLLQRDLRTQHQAESGAISDLLIR